MPLAKDGRKGCVSFEERILKLIVTNQIDSPEYQTWKELFGEAKLTAILEKFRNKQANVNFTQNHVPDEEGWILVLPDEFDILRPEDILEYGSELPGGAIYMKLRGHAGQAKMPELALG